MAKKGPLYMFHLLAGMMTRHRGSLRLWLFRFAAVVIIPAVLFLLLEFGLRVVGYGFPPGATVKRKMNGTGVYCDNVKFGWRFFPRNIARESDPFVFPADKPKDTYRIFVFGASAARGEPNTAFSFGKFLKVMLRQRYPQVKFEVINTSMTAINSHVVLEIAKDCAKRQPDVFVVYLGNNEVVGPYGAGTVFGSLSSNLFFIRSTIAIKGTRLGQMMTNLLELTSGGNRKLKSWGGMGMFLEKQVRADSESLETVYRHFQSNLEDISRAGLRSGANVILSTVGSNLKDNPPFASSHKEGLSDAQKQKWEDIYDRDGVEYETAGYYAKAVERYLAAAEIDDSYADLHFRLGRCYWAMGEYAKARNSYIKARQLDTIRFRAELGINGIIRKVHAEMADEGVHFVDAAKMLEENSPHNTTGEELFYEHVHLNFTGNYLLAKAVFEQVGEILPPWIKQKASKGSFPTESDCQRYLAYTNWDRYISAKNILDGFMKNPPFTNQLYHDEDLKQMEQEVNALKTFQSPEGLREAAEQYRWAIQRSDSNWHLNWKYGQLLEEMNDYQAAAVQYRLLRDLFHTLTPGMPS